MTRQEFQQLLDQGGIADFSPRVKIILRGPDKTRYLQGQVTNDLTLLEQNNVIEACLCNAKGKFEAHVFIRQLTEPKTNHPGETETAYLIDAHPALGEDDFLLNRLDKYLIADDCELIDVTEKYRLLHILHPHKSPDALSFHSNRFGTPGTDLLVNTLHDSIEINGLALANPADWEPLRIAHGIPAWGHDLTPDILPPEAGPAFISRNISYTKGCYIGQETISRLKSVGRVNKQLAALITITPIADQIPAPAWNLFPISPPPGSPAKPIGHLTSTAHHPLLDTSIALAFLKRDFLQPGTRFLAAPPDTDPHITPCATLEIRETPIR
jgi:folate-binding protein YgfZ